MPGKSPPCLSACVFHGSVGVPNSTSSNNNNFTALSSNLSQFHPQNLRHERARFRFKTFARNRNVTTPSKYNIWPVFWILKHYEESKPNVFVVVRLRVGKNCCFRGGSMCHSASWSVGCSQTDLGKTIENTKTQIFPLFDCCFFFTCSKRSRT